MTTFRCHQCGACCGPVVCSRREWKVILKYIRGHQIVPVFRDDLTCPLLGDDKRCMVYPMRPALCRLQGRVLKLPCPHNKGSVPAPMAVVKELKARLPATLADGVMLISPANYAGAGVRVEDRRRTR